MTRKFEAKERPKGAIEENFGAQKASMWVTCQKIWHTRKNKTIIETY